MEKDQKAKESNFLCTALSVHPAWKKAQTIALFYPLPDEPFLLPLLTLKSATWCFPDWDFQGMVFRRWTPSPLSLPEKDPVRPPRDALEIPPEKIDLILVPGIAFDALGGRLGRGAGFYDRYLSQSTLRAHKTGVGFSVQKVPHVPRECWDISLDEVLFGQTSF